MTLGYRTVTVDGLPTTYLDEGDPSLPVVVLLHDGGYGSDARSCWAPLIPRLAERYRVVAPDLLGHGGSPKAFYFDADPMTQRLRHVSAFLAALALEQPAMVGSSFGGGMILQAGVRRTWPMSCGVSICGPGGIFMVAERFAELQSYEPSLEAAGEIAGLLLSNPSPDEVKRRYEASMAPGHWEALSAARLRNPASTGEPFDWRPQFREALGSVDTPMLLIAGDQDPLLAEDWETSMAALLGNGRGVEIANARHQPHLDHPDQVAEVLLAFLGDHVAR